MEQVAPAETVPDPQLLLADAKSLAIFHRLSPLTHRVGPPMAVDVIVAEFLHRPAAVAALQGQDQIGADLQRPGISDVVEGDDVAHPDVVAIGQSKQGIALSDPVPLVIGPLVCRGMLGVLVEEFILGAGRDIRTG